MLVNSFRDFLTCLTYFLVRGFCGVTFPGGRRSNPLLRLLNLVPNYRVCPLFEAFAPLPIGGVSAAEKFLSVQWLVKGVLSV